MTTSAPTPLQSVYTLVDSTTVRPDGSWGFDGRPIYGVRVVQEWVARSLISPRKRLVWARDVGEYFAELLHADFTIAELEERRRAYQKAAESVDFVVSCPIGLAKNPQGTGNQFAVVLSAPLTIRGAGKYPFSVGITAAAALFVNFGGY